MELGHPLVHDSGRTDDEHGTETQPPEEKQKLSYVLVTNPNPNPT